MEKGKGGLGQSVRELGRVVGLVRQLAKGGRPRHGNALCCSLSNWILITSTLETATNHKLF